jgi:hypothetical protein
VWCDNKRRGTYILIWNCSEYFFEKARAVRAGLEHTKLEFIAADTDVHATV